jgi:hypothetical protein
MPEIEEPSQNDENSAAYAAHLSRRGFLKAVGATVAGSLAASLSIPPHLAVAAATSTAAPAEPWAIAAASPLLQQAVSELTTLQFAFALDGAHFHHTSDYLGFVGLILPHRSASSRRCGVDLVLTVDMQARALTAVHYVIGWCLEGSLELNSGILDGSPPELLQTRGGVIVVPAPRHDRQWTFARNSASIDPPPNPLPIDGWPPDASAACPWYYGGCITTAWAASGNVVIQRGTQVIETHSCQPGQTRTLNLS